MFWGIVVNKKVMCLIVVNFFDNNLYCYIEEVNKFLNDGNFVDIEGEGELEIGEIKLLDIDKIVKFYN